MRRQQGFNAKMDRTKKRKNSTGNTAKDTTADRSSGAAQKKHVQTKLSFLSSGRKRSRLGTEKQVAEATQNLEDAKLDRTNDSSANATDDTADRSSGAAQENPRWTMAMDDEEDEEGRLVFHFFIDSKFKIQIVFEIGFIVSEVKSDTSGAVGAGNCIQDDKIFSVADEDKKKPFLDWCASVVENDKVAARDLIHAIPKETKKKLGLPKEVKPRSDSMICVVGKDGAYRFFGLENRGEDSPLIKWMNDSSNGERGIFKCPMVLVAACSPRAGRTFCPKKKNEGEEARTMSWLAKDIINALPPGTWDAFDEIAVPVLEFFNTATLLDHLEKNPDKVEAVLNAEDEGDFVYDAKDNKCKEIDRTTGAVIFHQLFPQIVHKWLREALRSRNSSKLQFFGIRIWNNDEFENLVKSRLQAFYCILSSQSKIKAPMMHMRSKTIYNMCEKFGPNELSNIAKDFDLLVFDHPICQAYREGGSRFGQSIRPYWTPKEAIAAKKSKCKAGVSGQRSIRRYRYWTPEEDGELLDLYEMYGSNWSLIAERITTKRDATSCRQRYDYLAERIDSSLPKRDKRIIVKWTPEENKKLIELYNNGTDWETIASAIGRSVLACRRQYDRLEERIDSLPKRDKRIIVKWTPEENEKLIELFKKGADWETIASAIGRRVLACRRQYDKLEESIDSLPKHDKRIRIKWTPEENEKLMDLYKKYGHIKRGKWPKIAQSMGKSIRSVQERWRKNRTSRTM